MIVHYRRLPIAAHEKETGTKVLEHELQGKRRAQRRQREKRHDRYTHLWLTDNDATTSPINPLNASSSCIIFTFSKHATATPKPASHVLLSVVYIV